MGLYSCPPHGDQNPRVRILQSIQSCHDTANTRTGPTTSQFHLSSNKENNSETRRKHTHDWQQKRIAEKTKLELRRKFLQPQSLGRPGQEDVWVHTGLPLSLPTPPGPGGFLSPWLPLTTPPITSLVSWTDFWSENEKEGEDGRQIYRP
jgi:hypothetical protein